jgi:hypothetical protein
MRTLLFLCLILTLAACASQGDPTETVESYLNARVESDADELRNLACADWESQAALQADSFRSMDARLEDLVCTQGEAAGEFTLVSCDGRIVTTYDGETREWPLGTYLLLQEDGEWKMCGEAD